MWSYLGSEDGSNPPTYTRYDVASVTSGWTPDDGTVVYVYQDGMTLVGTATCQGNANNPGTIDYDGHLALSGDVGSLDGSTVTLVPVSGSWISGFNSGGSPTQATCVIDAGGCTSSYIFTQGGSLQTIIPITGGTNPTAVQNAFDTGAGGGYNYGSTMWPYVSSTSCAELPRYCATSAYPRMIGSPWASR